jgi:hypothetical protein
MVGVPVLEVSTIRSTNHSAITRSAKSNFFTLLNARPKDPSRFHKQVHSFTTSVGRICCLLLVAIAAFAAVTARILVRQSLALSIILKGILAREVYPRISKRIRKLRKKLVFEFMTLILGSGGNNMCLLLFWPGWWLIAIVVMAILLYCG